MTLHNVQGRDTPMPQGRMTKQEKIWQAEEDARTLARANVILQDKTRLSSAKKAAAVMATEEKKEATAMDKVAHTKTVVGRQQTEEKRTTRKRRTTRQTGTQHNVFQKI